MRIEVIVFGTITAIVIIGALVFGNVNVSELQGSVIRSSSNMADGSYKSGLPSIGTAPELVGTQEWINSQPLKIKDLKGKVVVIDFWTYSCINCIRTMPYLNALHDKYADKGLVIIGVHTPEFEFEKDYNNVKDAVEKFGIKHPVVQDNDYATWRAYKNNFWPRKYIIDKDGNIRYDHIGEGGYEETEKTVQELLMEINHDLEMNITPVKNTDFSQIGTPELYLGYGFARQPLGNAEGFSPGNVVDYNETDDIQPNRIYLVGKWRNDVDSIVAVENSGLLLYYKAKELNIVAGGVSEITATLDGKYIGATNLGSDVVVKNSASVLKINGERLYNIISAQDYGAHLLQINASPGFELYTFTFG